jgi:two-component system osmolarity sensor histidine kinase EnvZ
MAIGGRQLQAGFFPDRYAVRPPLAAVTLVSIGTFLVLLTALLLVRRITVPLARASRAAGVVGKGGMPEPLPETGPQELADLARRFNQMAREVQQLLENRTTLLGGISHDLRTPLTRLQLKLELLQTKFDPAKLSSMEKDLAEMNAMIGGYIELARSTQPEMAQEIDLDELLQKLSDKHGARYQSGRSCHFRAGPGALARILDNLLQNAHRYGAEETVPELRLKCGTKHVEIAVLDSGPGIPEAELEKVLRPFYRLETSRAAATGGTGLGLAIVKQLAEINGWEIRLHNRAEGGLEARLILSVDSSPSDRLRR